MRKQILRALVVLFAVLASLPSAMAQNVIQIGAQTNAQTFVPYTEYYYYSRYRSCQIYSEYSIEQAGGSPGMIERVEFNAYTNATYGNNFSIVPASAKNMKVYLANSPLAYLPTTGTQTFENLIGGNAPYNFTNIQEVYDGPGFTANYTNGDWAGITFDTPYQYTGGHLAVILARSWVPDQVQDYPGYPAYLERYGAWYYTYIPGNPPGETNTELTMAYWYGYTSGTYSYDYGAYEYDRRPNIRIYISAGIEESFPEDTDPRRIVRSGYPYTQEQLRTGVDVFSKPYLRFRANPGDEITYSYKIVGPLPSQNIIYQATDESGNTTLTYDGTGSGLQTVYMPMSNGNYPAAYKDNNGNVIDGSMDLTNIVGGAYRVIAEHTGPGGVSPTWTKDFIITYDYDASVREIVAPYSASRGFKYPRNIQIPVSIKFQNVGLNQLTDFRAIVTVEKDGTELYRDTSIWEGNMSTGDQTTILFDAFTETSEIGTYDLCAEIQMLNATDQGIGNNIICDQFKIQHEIEAEMQYVADPVTGTDYYANRPIVLRGVMINNGISDLSNIPVKVTITKDGNTVHEQTMAVQNLPSGEVPVDFFFPQTWTPTEFGEYEATMCINYPPNVDGIPSNDCATSFFTIEPQMSGNYLVGVSGFADFETIQDAIDALYTRGISGPVTFELIDQSYTEVNQGGNAALDFRSRIVGVSAENTITWKPTTSLANSRANIKINLESTSGIGMLFGQAHPDGDNEINEHAIVHQFRTDKLNAQPSGYMTWDGGEHSAIQFRLKSQSGFRAVVYLGQGASNYTFKNIVFDNDPTSTPSFETMLPIQKVSEGQFFSDENDIRLNAGEVETYSAAVVIRNTMPFNQQTQQNNYGGVRLDTLKNMNNMIVNSEISGFGYGVVDLGMGHLFVDNTTPDFQRYYNEGTVVRGNKIKNVAKAGVFLGYSEGAMIEGNRIWNVGDAVGYNGPAAGVMAGFDRQFSNVNARISANEISGVASSTYAAGVVVSPNPVTLTHPSGFIVRMPSGELSMKAKNNIVWGLERASDDADLAGIHFLTGRDMNAQNPMVTPRLADYWTGGDLIANNTVVVGNDDMTGAGAIVGIGVQQADEPRIYNNAVAVIADENAAAVQTGLFYQGVQPMEEGGLISDRNAFYTPNSSLAYMIETTDQSVILDAGSNDMFSNLSQWRALTNQDNNSVVGNFVAEHEFVGAAPMMLRVESDPTPMASILNNRGFRLSSVVMDIDGNERGQAEQRYDIGANEFNGRSYITDLESVEITSPRAYRRTNGMFSEAEYVMTYNPVSVDALFRNAGSLPQSGVDVNVKIFRDGNLVVEQTRAVSIDAGETIQTTFDFNGNFEAQTYNELGLQAPEMFSTMDRNVTPVYTIEISTISDQNMSNNVATKDVRFYVYSSPNDIMISANRTTVMDPQGDDIAGKLNFDNVIYGMSELTYNYDEGDFNVLDRDNWEPYSIDYSPMQLVVYSADHNPISRLERDNIREHLAAGVEGDKSNLLIAGQDIVRNHMGEGVLIDQPFVNEILRAEYVANTPVDPNYDGLMVIGDKVSTGYRETIEHTGYTGDTDPIPGAIQIYSDANTTTQAEAAYRYQTTDPNVNSDIMGTAVVGSQAGSYYNVIFYAVDWRHFTETNNNPNTGIMRVLAGARDYFNENAGGILGVDLVGFDANKLNSNSVKVEWTTLSEENTARFDVERRDENATSFAKVGEVAAAGNSNVELAYDFVDNTVSSNDVYTYRLRTVDFDGSTQFSQEVTVDMRDVTAGEFWLGQAQPNPVAETSTIAYGLSEANEVSVELFNVAGEKVQTLFRGYRDAGEHTLTVEASTLPSGTYMYVLRIGSEQVSKTLKVVK